MDLQPLFDTVLFSFGQYSLNLGQVFAVAVVVVVLLWILRLIKRLDLNSLFFTPVLSKEESTRIKRNIQLIFLVMSALIVIRILKLDLLLYENQRFDLRISTIIFGVLILLFARFLDWVISQVIIHRFYLRRDEDKKQNLESKYEDESTAGRAVQWMVYIFAVLLILNSFDIDYTLFTFPTDGLEYNFKISNIFRAILVFFVARLIIWIITQIILYGYYRRQKVNIGSQFAVNQLLKYVVYVISTIIALEILGIQMTLLWGGAAALLVGVGLGLQQTFNDFISGIILLFERSVEVGDVLEVDKQVGTVKKIGLRASLIETLANTTIIVPNSKLVSNSVNNWSHFYNLARFDIQLGVAYGSDTELVKQELLKVVGDNPHVLDYPSPFVRLSNFGDSALIFDIFFFSRDFIIIEDIKSDIRFGIDKAFREQNIKIPFPQREIWNAE